MRSVRGAVATGSLCDVPEITMETRSLLPVLTPCCPQAVRLQIRANYAEGIRGETMNRLTTIAFHLLVASLVLGTCFAARTLAQTPSASPSSTKAPETKPAAQESEANPFAPPPAPPLPAEMTGPVSATPPPKRTRGMNDQGEQ